MNHCLPSFRVNYKQRLEKVDPSDFYRGVKRKRKIELPCTVHIKLNHFCTIFYFYTL